VGAAPSPRVLPRDWTATRARLDANQLRAEFGPLTVPAALAAAEASAPTEQPPPD